MAKTRKRKGQIARIVEPEYLSIVKSPSNRTGFKIIRSADNTTDRVMRFRKKRSDTGLLSIDLPAGVSLDQAQSILELFDLGEDYEIAESGGVYSLIRKGSDMSVDTVTINLGEGIFANVASSSFGRSIRSEDADQDKFDKVQLVALEFTGDDFTTVESVREWLDSRDIDFVEGGVYCDEVGSPETGEVRMFTVLRTKREDAANCTQNMTVNLGNGVTGILGFAEETDIPKQVYRQIVETAYGSWGIWQLDFAAALADKEFTDESYEAMDTLNMVLHNVMFSDKTIAERKTLVQSVLKQFGQYVNSLLDSLPIEVMRKTYSKDHKLLKQESDNMSNEAKKVDGQDGAENTPAADIKVESLSREDVETMVSDAIAKAIGPVAAALETLATQVKNSTPAPEEKKEEATDKEDTEEIAKISRSVAEMGESMKTVMESIAALKGQVEEIGSTTVARSDSSNDGDTGEQSNKRNSPFAGLFSGLGVGAR
jgi:hypothetical protein